MPVINDGIPNTIQFLVAIENINLEVNNVAKRKALAAYILGRNYLEKIKILLILKSYQVYILES